MVVVVVVVTLLMVGTWHAARVPRRGRTWGCLALLARLMCGGGASDEGQGRCGWSLEL